MERRSGKETMGEEWGEEKRSGGRRTSNRGDRGRARGGGVPNDRRRKCGEEKRTEGQQELGGRNTRKGINENRRAEEKQKRGERNRRKEERTGGLLCLVASDGTHDRIDLAFNAVRGSVNHALRLRGLDLCLALQ